MENHVCGVVRISWVLTFSHPTLFLNYAPTVQVI